MAFLYALAWYYKYSRDARGDFNISPHFKNFSGFARQKKTGEAVGLPLLVSFPRILHKFKAYALNLKGKRNECGPRVSQTQSEDFAFEKEEGGNRAQFSLRLARWTRSDVSFF